MRIHADIAAAKQRLGYRQSKNSRHGKIGRPAIFSFDDRGTGSTAGNRAPAEEMLAPRLSQAGKVHFEDEFLAKQSRVATRPFGTPRPRGRPAYWVATSIPLCPSPTR